MTLTKAYAAPDAHSPLAPFEIDRRSPRAQDVAIEVMFCGVCHTDIHMTRGHFPNSLFPMVPGHEIIGRVIDIGSSVTKFQIGDTVGVGCFVDSCRDCHDCADHLENYCTEMVGTYNAYELDGVTRVYGGYASHIIVDENYVLRVSPDVSPAHAAPLLCAGITTYSPLRHWNVGKGSKVGVIGLGGLGHLAVKLAVAMGAEVTVFSTSNRKRADAIALGATSFVVTTDASQMEALHGTLALILSTVSANVDVDSYLGILRRDGALVMLGIPDAPSLCNTVLLGMKRKALSGSMIGSIAETQEMLDFCAANNINADIEIIDIASVNDAYEKILASDVRYRFVIDMASLT